MDYESINEPIECRLVIALADVVGFAKMSRTRSNLEAFAMLQEFYELVGDIVEGTSGRVVKFIGDAALIVFPETRANEAVAALRELKARAHTIWSTFDATCALHIKADVGTVACGPLGGRDNKRFDVIGSLVDDLFLRSWDAPELSAELEQLAAQ